MCPVSTCPCRRCQVPVRQEILASLRIPSSCAHSNLLPVVLIVQSAGRLSLVVLPVACVRGWEWVPTRRSAVTARCMATCCRKRRHTAFHGCVSRIAEPGTAVDSKVLCEHPLFVFPSILMWSFPVTSTWSLDFGLQVGLACLGS